MLKVLLVVLLMGAAVYLVVRLGQRGFPGGGRTAPSSFPPPRPKPMPKGPDDDPDFLRDLERKRRQKKKDKPPDTGTE